MVLENLRFRIWAFWYGYVIEMDSRLHSIQWLCIFFLASTLIGSMIHTENMKVKYAIELAEQKYINGNQVKSLEELSNNLERLLDPKTSSFADVTIKCGSVSTPAHKNILSARSPVFAAMFYNTMNRSHHIEVEENDVDPSILRTFLIYIYTGKTNNLSVSSAANLLIAAEKYELHDLKKECSDILKDTLSIQNVLKLLILGDLYSEDLKSYAVDFIYRNCTDFSVIEKTQDWRILRKEKPDLAMYVLTALVNSKKN